MKNCLTLLLGVFIMVCGFSQTNNVNSNFWTKSVSSARNSAETSYQNTYDLSVDKFKEVLSRCPKRFDSFGPSNVIITLPTEDGKFKQYRVKEASALHPDLAKKFPDIKSYVGTSVDEENEVVYFSMGYNNFRAMIMKPDATITNIKPLIRHSKTYTVTSKVDGSAQPISCETTGRGFGPLGKSIKQVEKSNQSSRDANDGRLRVYRMAIAVTGELSKIYIDAANATNGSIQQRKAAVLAGLNALMTRANAVYERDLGTTFQLVPNMDAIIFLDGRTDGLTHNSIGTANREAQPIIDNVIGDANYDIGHVLDSKGTGRAALNVVCVSGKKALGGTGAHPFTSVADYFFITFIHEIGHQFGANHSFNNACGGNRLDEGAVEPGGGNTIMAYTGCAPNTGRTQYIYFHAKQIDEMWNHIENIGGCATLRSIGNSAPVASIRSNYTIPRSTPFILEGSATDANTPANQLTYTWDQMDKEIAPMPPRANSTVGPLFRYVPPSSSPIRYMPDLATVKAGNTASEWEVVPSVSRTMNFRFTVRDNHPGGGNTDSRDAVITVAGNAGPFVVTSQNTRFDAPIGSRQTVTWNVAGTTGNGINASTVDILLSTDGGNTYPITLASRVTNDGSHQVTIPNNEGGVNRIMVRGSNHIFYDITNANFSITDGNSDPMPTNYCSAGNRDRSNYIAKVVFADISNESDNSAYSDFTSIGTNLVKGRSATITVTPGIPGWIGNTIGAWIDWNKNGSFTDPGEEILMQTLVADGIASANVLVPNSAKNGATRLRVRYKLRTNPDPCGTAASNGNEVEDYFVFITGEGIPDNQNPSTPTNLAASNIRSSSLTLTWTASTDNVGVSGYEVFRGNTSLGTVTGTTYNATGLTPQTTYNFRVRARDASGNQSNFSNTASATTLDGTDPDPTLPTGYCNAGRQGTNYIATVAFGSINNTSQNSSYSDFSAQSTNVSVGQTLTLTVTPGFTANNWSSNVVGGWIDWNRDGDFEDANEQVLMKPRGVGGGSASVTVPNNAQSGATKLRVRYRWGSNPNPCGTSSNDGDEVEDYVVVIGGGTSDTQAPSTPTNLRASNIGNTSLSLTWTASTDNVGVSGYNVFRGNTNLGTVTGTSYNVTGLTANTAYSFRVRARDAAGNQSNFSNTANATTTGGTDPDPTLPTGYCNAGRQGSNYIASVTFGSINNSSQNSNYSNFSTQSTNVSVGQTLTLTVTPGFTANNWSSNVVGGWIDWNRDGDFEDANEQVLMKPRGVGGGSASVTVPNNAQSGATKLRVRYRWSSNPNPCGTSSNDGDEVEDYVVVIGGGTTNPTCNDGVQNGNETGIDCGGSCPPCQVIPTCNDGIQNGNETGIDCGGSCTPCQTNVTYCNAGRRGANYIAEVTFGSISQSSQNGSYTNYTSQQSTTVSRGQSLTLTVTPGITASNWSSNVVGGWIDWNRNGSFDDAGEQVLMKPRGVGGASVTVVVPNNAQTGTTRLRVRYRWFGNPNPCGTSSADGDEVEDYAINVAAAKSGINETRVSLSPNPFTNNVTVDVSSLGNSEFTVTVYSILGKELIRKSYKENPERLIIGEELKATGNYFLKVQSKDFNQTLRLLKL
ncbi:GEVED domain-containing protein [Aquimarina sp. 2201CG1-2-11]|uniref:GEVED domain-containing protein n=1 Tax=Aquimarina discodermiae TaxID=3231043 RepID=UPI003462F23D